MDQMQHAPAAPQQPRKTSGLAITALVLACLFFIPLVPLVGSILGIVALVRLSGRPHLSGTGLAIAAIPVGLVVVFFLQGIMAAVAIPAFIKYTRKSKTIEATEALDKVRVGARAYAQSDHFNQNGQLLPKGFPAGDTGWTPSQGCCQGPSAPKCVSDAAQWQAGPWAALHFALSGPHYFQYRYVGRGQQFVVEARGDLDCDGTYSNYRLEGRLDPEQGVVTRGPIITNELE